MKLLITELPYFSCTNTLLNNLRPLGQLVALESADGRHENGQWSIIASGPIKSIPLSDLSASNVLAIEELKKTIPLTNCPLPFCGGVIGHASYGEVGNCSEKPAQIIAGLYTWALLVDHLNKKSFLVYWTDISNIPLLELKALINKDTDNESFFSMPLPFKPLWSKQHYKSQFEKVREYLLAGDCYQVNLTQLFHGSYTGDPLAAYFKLKSQSNSPYLVYFESDNLSVASASPEQFIQCKNEVITTKPIKGTAPRSSNKLQDKLNIETLSSSLKDKAENLMITDLLRNDLSVNCKQVKVDNIFAIESFESVHHLVTSISAVKPKDISAFKVFLDAFPGGSITGAPKKRAMEIIGELEDFSRSFYCGSSFFYSANNNFSSNILIRSFTFKDGIAKCWGGGGITIDSRWELEYQESLDKVSRLMTTIDGSSLN